MTKATAKTTAAKTTAAKTTAKKQPRAGVKVLHKKGVADYLSKASVALIEWPRIPNDGTIAVKRVDSIGYAIDTFIAGACNGLPDIYELVAALRRLSNKYQRHNDTCPYKAAAHTYKHAAECVRAYKPKTHHPPHLRHIEKAGFNPAEILPELEAPCLKLNEALRLAASAARAKAKQAAAEKRQAKK